MKIVIFDTVYNTKSLSPRGIQTLAQMRLDAWLGIDKVKLDVVQLADRAFKFTLWRDYGPWYKDPKCFSNCNENIVDVDANIFLGTNYQTGTVADFSQHPGWCIWQPDIKTIFLRDMRDMARKYHGTRIKSIEADNYLDHIDLVITY